LNSDEMLLSTLATVIVAAIGIRLGETAKRFLMRSLIQVLNFIPCQNRGAR
jgi:hypothetical protein